MAAEPHRPDGHRATTFQVQDLCTLTRSPLSLQWAHEAPGWPKLAEYLSPKSPERGLPTGVLLGGQIVVTK